MKKRIVLSLLSITLAFAAYVSLTSSASGGAFNSNADGTCATGTGNACNGCHGSSTSITVTVELDSAGVAVTHYVPGNSYTLKVSGTNGTTSTLPKYGFQVAMVKSAGAGTSSAVNAGTLGTTGLPTGVRYTSSASSGLAINVLEHNTALTATTGTGTTGTTYVMSNLPWTAPATGTGTVMLYGCINAVNGTGTTGGDKWNKATPVTISEWSVPSVLPITGTATVCVSATTTLSDATTGGTWTSGSTGIATVGATTGIVTGVAAGTSVITYTAGAGSATRIVTVNPLPNAGSITGTATVCAGSTITLNDATTGGTWSSVSTGVATISTGGVVTAVSAGTSLISYTVTNSCGTAVATATVTVNPLPNAGSITGTATVCAGSTITLNDATTGGTWSSVSTGVATISTGGVVTGVSSGTSVISYTVTNSCGTATTTATVTVNPLPNAGSITGTATLCAGSTITLNDATTGGTWNSVSTGVVLTGGVVTGVSAGTSLISYTVTNTCGTAVATATVTVNPLPNAGSITGTAIVCAGSNTTLSDAATGGTWNSVSTGVATISTGGVATGVSAGTSLISYSITNSCGTAVTTATVTVNPLPNVATITGTTTFCHGSTSTLVDVTTGGTWSSVTTGVATISSGGIVTGVSSGSSVISYTLTNGCGSTAQTTTVDIIGSPSTPASIAGSGILCTGGNLTLTDATTGGVWSSVSTGVATISTGGVVTGVSAGTSLISYTVSNSCGSSSTTASVTVDAAPTSPAVITGTTNFCQGTTSTLANVTTGGTWSSVTTGVATISSGGIVTGVSTGSSVISYTLTNSCGSATSTTTVNITGVPSTPTAIGGGGTLCTGGTLTLTDLTTGGVWSSASTAITTVTTAGIVTGVAAGTSVLSYTVSNSCGSSAATTIITVNAAPYVSVITDGSTSICVGTTTTFTDTVTTGSWSITNANASIAGSGIVTGISAGIDTIVYSVSNTCGTTVVKRSFNITTVATIDTISGSSLICTGTTVTYTDGVGGGAWSTNNGLVTISTAGVVNALSAGTDTIFYNISGSCGATSTSKIINIITTPSVNVITGTDSVCTGSNITLSDISTGGTWSASNANAGVSGGIVTGNTGGIDTIIYSVSNFCGSTDVTKIVAISTPPTADNIAGTDSVCAGSSITLSDVTTGGTWIVSNAHASVVAGVVTGLTAGVDTITYSVSNTCGSTSVNKSITVNAVNAGSISGLDSVCIGASITLTEVVSTGTWTSSNTHASVSGGIVTGLSTGMDTIAYSVTNSCGTAQATYRVNVIGVPNSGSISGISNICSGTSTTFTDTVSGGSWSVSNSTISSITTSGVFNALSTGIDTIRVTFDNACSSSTATMVVTINTIPFVSGITGIDSVCAGSFITLSEVTTGGAWTASNAHASVIAGTVTGISSGVDTIIYTILNTCGNASANKIITVNAMPDAGSIAGFDSVCTGTSITLTDVATGGTWTLSNSNASNVSGVVHGVIAGTDTLIYTVINNCSIASVSKIINIIAPPTVSSISGTDSVCIGASVTLTDSVSGGIWSIHNANASLTGGIVHGLSAGFDTVNYTITNMCGSATAHLQINILPVTTVASITGAGNLCVGVHTTLLDSTGSGTWSSANTSLATITTGGVITPLVPGVDTIKYTIFGYCGNAETFHIVTVNALPDAGSIIGNDSVCTGSTLVLTDAVTGGVWTSTNTSIATVTGGVVSGLTVGMDTIKYTVSNICGAISADKIITAITTPAPNVTGVSYVCIGGANDSLYGTPAGGVWTVVNGNATVFATGEVVGLIPGIDTVLYTVTNLCGAGQFSFVVNIFTSSQCDSVDRVNNTFRTSNDVIKIVPNPSTGMFTIAVPQTTGAISLLITDIYGKAAYSSNLESVTNGLIPVELTDISSGTYFVKLTIGEKVFVTKVVIW